MIKKENAINFIRHGIEGDYVFNDENGRAIERKNSYNDTLPICYLYDAGGSIIGEQDFWSAIEYLFG